VTQSPRASSPNSANGRAPQPKRRGTPPGGPKACGTRKPATTTRLPHETQPTRRSASRCAKSTLRQHSSWPRLATPSATPWPAAVAETNSAAVQLAFDLVEVLLGRELALAADPGADAIARVLDLAQGQQILELRLSPADMANTDLTVLQDAGIQAVADPALALGDAVADTGDSVLDASIRSAVDRLREQWSQ
jgi:hypothetical protein